MRAYRWWAALVATLLTPWIGPHIDRYVPVGWVLFQARTASADRGFWLLFSVVFCVAYVAWLLLFTRLAK